MMPQVYIWRCYESAFQPGTCGDSLLKPMLAYASYVKERKSVCTVLVDQTFWALKRRRAINLTGDPQSNTQKQAQHSSRKWPLAGTWKPIVLRERRRMRSEHWRIRIQEYVGSGRRLREPTRGPTSVTSSIHSVVSCVPLHADGNASEMWPTVVKNEPFLLGDRGLIRQSHRLLERSLLRFFETYSQLRQHHAPGCEYLLYQPHDPPSLSASLGQTHSGVPLFAACLPPPMLSDRAGTIAMTQARLGPTIFQLQPSTHFSPC